MKPQQKLKLRKALAHSCLIGCVAIVLIPFVMVVVASLRKGHFPPSTLWIRPDQWSFEHWKFVLGIPYQEIANPATGELRTIQASTPPLLWLWNSVLISSWSSFGIILLSGTAAYAFARMHFKFRGQILNALLILQMFPGGVVAGRLLRASRLYRATYSIHRAQHHSRTNGDLPGRHFDPYLDDKGIL
jgi:maltose/maltodextrin transport system permease protein